MKDPLTARINVGLNASKDKSIIGRAGWLLLRYALLVRPPVKVNGSKVIYMYATDI